MDVAAIDAIVEGQVERNVKDNTNGTYISNCSVMTSMIRKVPALRAQSLVLDADGNALMHSGKAKAIQRLKLSIDEATAKRLFALISVDKDLPEKKRSMNTVVDLTSRKNCKKKLEKLFHPPVFFYDMGCTDMDMLQYLYIYRT